MKTLNKSQKIVFIGGGAHVTALLDFFTKGDGWDVLGYVDVKKTALHLSYLGTDRELLKHFHPRDVLLVMGIGSDVKLRAKVFSFFKEQEYGFVSYVHPFSTISPGARIAQGCIIFPGVVLGREVDLKENVCVYSSSVIEHGTSVGANSYISPAVAVGGNCKIGAGCFLGINSTLIEGIVLGQGIVVGAGAVVVQGFEQEHVKLVGVPARIIGNADD